MYNNSLPFQTLLYQLLVNLADWRSFVNHRLGRNIPGVAAIANPRDERDVRNLGYSKAEDLPEFLLWNKGHLACHNPLGDVKLQMYMIGSVSNRIFPSLANRPHIEKARSQLKSAIAHAVSHGYSVVALTASTKRIMSPEELRREFPGVVFTLGDNLTALALWEQVKRVMKKANLSNPRVLVVGPNGFLGTAMLERLKMAKYDVIGLSSHLGRSKPTAERFNVSIFQSFEDVPGPVDLIVACNHETQITSECIKKVFNGGKVPIPVVDVCEPPAFDLKNVKASRDMAWRVDADVYSSAFEFVLGRFAEWNMSLGHGMLYPCFAEAVFITLKPELSNYDWLTVDIEKQKLLKRDCFELGYFGLPDSFMCFGEPVAV